MVGDMKRHSSVLPQLPGCVCFSSLFVEAWPCKQVRADPMVEHAPQNASSAVLASQSSCLVFPAHAKLLNRSPDAGSYLNPGRHGEWTSSSGTVLSDCLNCCCSLVLLHPVCSDCWQAPSAMCASLLQMAAPCSAHHVELHCAWLCMNASVIATIVCLLIGSHCRNVCSSP